MARARVRVLPPQELTVTSFRDAQAESLLERTQRGADGAKFKVIATQDGASPYGVQARLRDLVGEPAQRHT